MSASSENSGNTEEEGSAINIPQENDPRFMNSLPRFVNEENPSAGSRLRRGDNHPAVNVRSVSLRRVEEEELEVDPQYRAWLRWLVNRQHQENPVEVSSEEEVGGDGSGVTTKTAVGEEQIHLSFPDGGSEEEVESQRRHPGKKEKQESSQSVVRVDRIPLEKADDEGGPSRSPKHPSHGRKRRR